MGGGTTDRSDESVDAGPEALLAAAQERDVAGRVHVLRHGETFDVSWQRVSVTDSARPPVGEGKRRASR